jgi:hypothetical protein
MAITALSWALLPGQPPAAADLSFVELQGLFVALGHEMNRGAGLYRLRCKAARAPHQPALWVACRAEPICPWIFSATLRWLLYSPYKVTYL